MLRPSLPRLPASPVRSSIPRLFAWACAAAALLALLGFGAELWRFGWTSQATAAQLERDVRDRFAQRARSVQSLGQLVARNTAGAVAAASQQPEDRLTLFDQLTA